MAFVFKAERKIQLTHTEEAKLLNLGPGSYAVEKPQSKSYHRYVSVFQCDLYVAVC